MSSISKPVDQQLERLVFMWRRIDATDPLRRTMLEKLVELIDLTLRVWEEDDDDVTRLSAALDHVWDEVEMRQSGFAQLPVYPLTFATGPNGIIVQANRQAERVLGVPLNGLVGRNLADIVSEQTRKAVDGVLAAPFAAPQRGAFNLSLVGAHGDPLPYQASVSLSTDADKHLLGMDWWLLPGSALGSGAEALLDTQERMRAAFEQGVVAMAHLHLNGDWVRVNEALCDVLDVECDVLLRQPFHLYLHPDDRQRDAKQFAELLDGRISSYSLDVRFFAEKAADPLWVRATVSLLRTDKGAPAYRVVVLEDITRRREAEEMLISALARARDGSTVGRNITVAQAIPAVVEALMESVSLADAHSALLLRFARPWAPGTAAPDHMSVLAVWPEEARVGSVGEQHLTRIYGLDALLVADEEAIVIPHVAADTRLSDDLRGLLGRLGEAVVLFPLTANAERYGLLAAGFPPGVSFSAEDRSYLLEVVRQAAAAIYTMLLLEGEAVARREAERANAMKMRLLATISHELRTPLTSIKGFATTLLADDVEWDADTQRDFISTINDEADKLGDLIDQLLDLSRLEAGMLRISPTRCTLDDVLDIAMAQLAMLAHEHTLHIALQESPQIIYADPQRVAQVITNLVNNAVKYSPAGTRISLSARAERGYTRISVSDEGVGIAAEDRERLFEPFAQGDPRKARSRQGAGLGLAISRGIVQAHGGRMWVEDTNGPGTTVSFTLPVFHTRED